MQIKVVKFGGSSLADANQIKKAADIIKADSTRRYVVPSAPGKRFSDDIKVTDMLYKCFDLASNGNDFSEVFEKIKERYRGIIAELGIDFSLEDEFETIQKTLAEKPISDYAASRGEYLNGKIIANYLGFEFIDSADVIFFNESGSLDSEKTAKVLSERLKNTEYAVIPGFYGRGANGLVKTFSRGGSDVTGSIVANAVKASIYENWTDVSGFLVCDPRIVENPEVIQKITYLELRELAYMGASVLHEEAIFPVRSAGIPINIKNTNRPQDPGTLIVPDDMIDDEYIPYTITGIAGKKGFSSINIRKELMNSETGFCSDLLKVLVENDISLEHMPSSIDQLSVIVESKYLNDKKDKVISDICSKVKPDDVEVEDGIALLAVVGRGMRKTRGTAARIFAALAHARINVKMIDQGSSEMNIIIGVSEDDFNEAVKCIYDVFVSSVIND
ncbi:MAG: aspartate kinase [Oscillospiraceae bacterium]|nr:aspartate kinase [Oscillospiraceae bacterium]MDD6086021.1 aspartate kinase [Oscillospiraceae bacterium]MDY3258603.1 aspartate kinase [Ruminococcus callidus]